MLKDTGTISIASSLLLLGIAGVGLTQDFGLSLTTFDQPTVAASVNCQHWQAWKDRPVARSLPATFDQGCVLYFNHGGNNQAVEAYVLKNGVAPSVPSQDGEIQAQQMTGLNGLVDQGQALKLYWYSPNTIGAQSQVNAIPKDLAFVDEGGMICQRIDRRVLCMASKALSNQEIVKFLRAASLPSS